MDGNDRRSGGRDEHAREPPAPRRVNVSDLLAGDRELILVHRQVEYRLRVTNNDKLILTK